MKKKIVSALTALSLMGGYAAMAEGNDKVEITFRVGDSVLTVNGAPLEVTAPYIVGEGTTLVPVRVITEAFGAEVVWDGTDQSVSLKYPEVDITIKIGSKSAIVNTHTEELAEAPQLYMDTTMVPLRFISETFGATVNWDNGLITVTKEAMTTGTTVEGATDMEYIGDSYYGWSMKNPKKLQMDEREFDGRYTSFSDESGESTIAVSLTEREEEIDIDTEFNDLKEILDGMTLTEAAKEDVGSGVKKIHLAAKDKEATVNIIKYISGKKGYMVYVVAATDSDLKDELIAISETFMINSTREMYDLSNVSGGYRTFTDDEYKISLKLPASWTSGSNDSNEFSFYDPESDRAHVSIGIYSKSETVTAAGLAATDRASKLNIFNEDCAVVSEVMKSKVNQFECVYYTVSVDSEGPSNDCFLNDTFIDYGDYVYNIAVYEDSPEEAGLILKTFNIDEMLDSAKVGKILRDSDIGGTHTISTMGAKITASDMWKTLDDALNVIIDARTGSFMTVINAGKPESTSVASFRSIVQELYNGMLKEGCCVSIKGIDTFNSTKNGTGYTFTMKHTSEDEEESPSYITTYVVRAGGNLYVIQYSRYDVYYDSGLEAEVKAMVEGLEAEK